jgi:hypothetical protein
MLFGGVGAGHIKQGDRKHALMGRGACVGGRKVYREGRGKRSPEDGAGLVMGITGSPEDRIVSI